MRCCPFEVAVVEVTVVVIPAALLAVVGVAAWREKVNNEEEQEEEEEEEIHSIFVRFDVVLTAWERQQPDGENASATQLENGKMASSAVVIVRGVSREASKA